jgi:L,D-peptidoglycan transpeptidase YkuD (ErfK/YbiS/YcfS/YnhG family)
MSLAAILAAGTLACAAPAPHLGNAAQAVTVAAAPGATTAHLELWQRSGTCWRPVAGPWRARVGRGGVSADKHEGDGATPAGVFPLGNVVYGLDPNPGVHLRYVRLRCGDWWDEDPGSPTYNRLRRLPCGARPPFGGASEALWRARVAYRELVVVRYNVDPVVPGRGSAIFLHDDLGHPTSGCVSLPRPRLLRLLRWLRAADHPRIAIRTT